jgi:hypothetical protein
VSAAISGSARVSRAGGGVLAAANLSSTIGGTVAAATPQRVGKIHAAPPAIICAFGDSLRIVFRHGESSIGAVTDAKQRPGFPADPPLHIQNGTRCAYAL